MNESFRRIYALIVRYIYLHQRSLARTLEIVFWPVMELVVWGFVTLYIESVSLNTTSKTALFLVHSMIFWDILYKSQQGVSLCFVEEIWTQNITNLLASPLKIWEWLTATYLYGLMKTSLAAILLALIAWLAYHYNIISSLGLYVAPLAFNLVLFGWSLGIFTSALLIRLGHASEALIWGIPFLIQPISAIFYPLEVMPSWLQKIALCLPSTYIFEGIRFVIKNQYLDWSFFLIPLSLNIFYFLLSILFFKRLFKTSQAMGRLVKLGLD